MFKRIARPFRLRFTKWPLRAQARTVPVAVTEPVSCIRNEGSAPEGTNCVSSNNGLNIATNVGVETFGPLNLAAGCTDEAVVLSGEYRIPDAAIILELESEQPYLDLKMKLMKVYRKRLDFYAIETPKWIENVRAQRHRYFLVHQFDALVEQSESKIAELRRILLSYQNGIREHFDGKADSSFKQLDMFFTQIGNAKAIYEPRRS